MKNVLITGAGGDLGSEVTPLFVMEDYHIIAVVSPNSPASKVMPHPNIDRVPVNLINERDTTTFIAATIKKYKKIDAALLLVGGFSAGDIFHTSGKDIKNMYATNFETAYYAARPLFTHMMEMKSGKIILIGSKQGLNTAAGTHAVGYALSKSLLLSLASILNSAAKGTEVVTTVVVPSTLDTIANRVAMPEKDPSKWVKPQEIAEIIRFICSEKASVLRETILKVYNNA